MKPRSRQQADESHGPLTSERARQLVTRLLQHDDDEQAAALIELMAGLGYEKNRAEADNLAVEAIEYAFTLCPSFGDAVRAFQARSHELVKIEEGRASRASK